jgi:hypothetical protein
MFCNVKVLLRQFSYLNCVGTHTETRILKEVTHTNTNIYFHLQLKYY